MTAISHCKVLDETYRHPTSITLPATLAFGRYMNRRLNQHDHDRVIKCYVKPKNTYKATCEESKIVLPDRIVLPSSLKEARTNILVGDIVTDMGKLRICSPIKRNLIKRRGMMNVKGKRKIEKENIPTKKRRLQLEKPYLSKQVYNIYCCIMPY